VLLDAMTAALLDDRFAVSGEDLAPVLAGEREPVEEVRKLLGKPTRCVGRERELSMLEGVFDQCASERTPHAVLISAGPGVGKSRLRNEIVQRLRARGAAVWIAHGDSTRQKTPLGMLAQAVRRAARLLDGEPVELRRQKLAAYVARHVDGAIQRRVSEFLGELVGTPFPAEDSVQLSAARREPMLMGDQMRRAWVDLLEAECQAHPVLLVLEDLQWCDRATVDFIDTALRLLEDKPFMVLAVARPEVAQTFPGLWSERALTSLHLAELSRHACEKLVRQTLGDDLPNEQVAQLIERSARNAFFLEELVRAVAEQRGDDVPDTVLAMMQSRLESLEPEARRLLRAGSLFGGRFWRGAVASLLGLAADAPRLNEQLAELERREWVTRRFESTFCNEAEYVFRHGLIREVAYGMLTEEDRALGHRLAGVWLEQAGEVDAMVLAEHFDQGGEPAQAARWYRTAAQQALEGNDLSAAIGRVERAVACGASDAALGELCLIRAEAHRWQGNIGDAKHWAERALEAFPKGSDAWFAAVREALASLVGAEDKGRILVIAGLLDELWSRPEKAGGDQVMAMAWMAIRLFALPLRERAETFHEKLRAVEERFAGAPAVHACIAMERAFREGYLINDMSSFSDMLRIAVERFEHVGNIRSASHMRVNLGHAYNELGAYRENVDLLTALLSDCKRLGLSYVEATVRSLLGKALLGLGRTETARTEAIHAIHAFAGQGDQRMEGSSHAYFAIILQRSRMLDQAEAEARKAVELLHPLPTLRSLAFGVLANVLLCRGCVPEAHEAASQAFASIDQAEEGEALVRLAHAEVLELSGDYDAARRAIAVARDRLLTRAAQIANVRWRRSFLENVPENVRTMALAETWLDED
jgi:tetratricopeptide (TPR) repeat protein